MQVDKNCNATGASPNNQQIVALGAGLKHGSDIDPKLKELQLKQPQDHTKNVLVGIGSDLGNGIIKATATAGSSLPGPTPLAGTATTIVPTVSDRIRSPPTGSMHERNPNQSQSAPMFTAVQVKAILHTTTEYSNVNSLNDLQQNQSASNNQHPQQQQQQQQLPLQQNSNAQKSDVKNVVSCTFN